VLVLGVLPRAEKHERLRTLVAETNAALERALNAGGEKSLLADRMIRYADIGARFVEADGSISKGVMPDLLHLSDEGYQRFAAAIAEATWEADRQPAGR
jgi:lysophospholipase L1-like esterase